MHPHVVVVVVVVAAVESLLLTDEGGSQHKLPQFNDSIEVSHFISQIGS